MGRPGQRDRSLRRAGPYSALHRALGRSSGQQRELLRQPGAVTGQRDRAGGTERLVRGAQHQPLRRVRQASGHAAEYAQPRAARADRHCRHRHQLHPEQIRHRTALRRPGDGQQPDQRRSRSGQRLLHHSDQRPQRQPDRGDERRRLLGSDQPADQRSAGHYPHRAHHREPHYPRACGAGGLAHPDHLRASRSTGPDLQLHPEPGGHQRRAQFHRQGPIHSGHCSDPGRHHRSAQRCGLC